MLFFLSPWGVYEYMACCLVKLYMSVSAALSVASVALCTLRLVEISVQTERKLSTSMTQHGGMHQRMWLFPSLSPSQSTLRLLLPLPLWAGPYAPSNYQGYFLQRAKSLFMGKSVCHTALAVNPQDADSVDNPRENRSFSDTAVARLCSCSAFASV